MKKQIFSFVLILGVTTSAWSQQTCPLTNAKLTDLRVAASKLAKTITMSAECQSYQNTVNQANKDLKNIAEQIKAAEEKSAAAAGTTTSSSTEPDKTQLAIAAVTQLDTLNSVFKDPKCGQELAGFLDYADAFVDVVNGMAPFLALYGGTAAGPWVLGPAIGGAAAKAVIAFFKNKAVNMRNPDQSNNFIKNSCAFYNLNVIKNSLDEVQLNQTPRVEVEVQLAKAKLATMIKNAPAKPSNSLVQELTLSEKDQVRLKALQEQLRVDSTEGCSYIVAYVTESDKNKDGSMLGRVWDLYERVTEAGFKLDLEKRYFQQDLTQVIANDTSKCSSLGSRWVGKMIGFNETGLAALRKAADEDGEVKGYREYLAEKEKQETLIKSLEAKLKFFNEMTSQGFNIEYSEIIRSHEQVQDALFQSYRYLRLLKMKGLAEAWLRVKSEDADARLSEFGDRKKEVEDRLEKIQKTIGASSLTDITPDAITNFVTNYRTKNNREHPSVTKSVLIDVCNQLRMTWASWYNALIHARAGRDYCVAFDNVINRMDYPEVQSMCFGTTRRNGKQVRSLRNQVTNIQAHKVEADQIEALMDQYACRKGEDVSSDLLARPVSP